jgi:CheY-like chemotaxis protein
MASGRVMFVDDEESLTRFAAMLLRRLGFEIHATTDPQGALDEIRDDPRAAALVTDLNMPAMTGIELAAKVRVLRPSMPIALCCGLISAGLLEAATAAGVDRVLAKPYTGDELAAVVEWLLARSRGTGRE